MITNSKVAYHEHDHARCEHAAMAQARNVCRARGARLTPSREAVLQLIWQNHKPIGAYALIEKLTALNGKRVLPPTVYRAIDFLLDLGLIHRIASLNSFIGCPFPGSAHSDLFLVCRACGSAAECSAEGINSAIAATAARAGFSAESQSVEILGLCPQCNLQATESTP